MVIAFVQERNLSTIKADAYFNPRPEKEAETENKDAKMKFASETKIKKNNKLIFHINYISNVQQLCIPSKVAIKIIAVAHGHGHPEFNRCYKTIVKLWYHQLIYLLLVPYYTLTPDFIFFCC